MPPTSSRRRLRPAKSRLHASQFTKNEKKQSFYNRQAEGLDKPSYRKKYRPDDYQLKPMNRADNIPSFSSTVKSPMKQRATIHKGRPAAPNRPPPAKPKRKIAPYKPSSEEASEFLQSAFQDRSAPVPMKAEKKTHAQDLADPKLRKQTQTITDRLEKDNANYKNLTEKQLNNLSKTEIKELHDAIDERYETLTEWFLTTNQSEDAEQEYFASLADDIVDISWDLALNPGPAYLKTLATDVMRPNGYGPAAQTDWTEMILTDLRDKVDAEKFRATGFVKKKPGEY